MGRFPFRLYLVTDRHRTRGRPLVDVVARGLAGGVDAVQLREKDLPGRELLALALELRALCHDHGAMLLINDRIDIALEAGADGVHLPADSFTAAEARRLLGPQAIVGVSTHSLAEARAAADSGADVIVFGPIYDTPSKRALGSPVGLSALADVCTAVLVPVLALGGVTVDRVAAVRAQGAHSVAVISAILEADDPCGAAQQLRAALDRPQPQQLRLRNDRESG